MLRRLFSNDSVQELVPQLILLSIVTSLALNVTAMRRLRRERNLKFANQRELLIQIRDQLRSDRRLTLLHSPDFCKKMVLVGLKPSEFGFERTIASEAESSLAPYSRHLSWYEVFFSNKSHRGQAPSPDIPRVESTNEDDWDGML